MEIENLGRETWSQSWPFSMKKVWLPFSLCEEWEWTRLVNLLHGFSIFTPILHLRRRRMKLLNLQRMGPPQFKEKVPRTHSLKIENGKKEVWHPLLCMNFLYNFKMGGYRPLQITVNNPISIQRPDWLIEGQPSVWIDESLSVTGFSKGP